MAVCNELIGKEFFEHVADFSHFSSMKLLKDIFYKMEISEDKVSHQIVKNINNIFNCEKVSKYFFVETDGYMSDLFANYDAVNYGVGTGIKTNLDSTIELISHELGHFFFDIVGDKEIPCDYYDIQNQVLQNLNMHSLEVINFLNYAKDYKNKLKQESILEAQKYIENHEEEKALFVDETLKSLSHLIHAARAVRLSQADIDSLVCEYLADKNESFICKVKKIYEWQIEDQIFSRNQRFDHESQILDMVTGLIDSMYNGMNPYYDNIYEPNLLRGHPPFYFEEVKTRGFDEQFADYVALRINEDTYVSAISLLKKWVGSDWFTMMEKYYFDVSNTLANMTETKKVCDVGDFTEFSPKSR